MLIYCFTMWEELRLTVTENIQTSDTVYAYEMELNGTEGSLYCGHAALRCCPFFLSSLHFTHLKMIWSSTNQGGQLETNSALTSKHRNVLVEHFY